MDLFPNQTAIFQWFLFVTAFLSLHFGVFRPILHLLRLREERTNGERERAEEMVKKGKIMFAECEKKIAEARTEGGIERESRILAGEEIVRGLLQQMKQETQVRLENLRVELEVARGQAMLQIQRQAQELGRDIAGKILGRPLTS